MEHIAVKSPVAISDAHSQHDAWLSEIMFLVSKQLMFSPKQQLSYIKLCGNKELLTTLSKYEMDTIESAILPEIHLIEVWQQIKIYLNPHVLMSPKAKEEIAVNCSEKHDLIVRIGLLHMIRYCAHIKARSSQTFCLTRVLNWFRQICSHIASELQNSRPAQLSRLESQASNATFLQRQEGARLGVDGKTRKLYSCPASPERLNDRAPNLYASHIRRVAALRNEHKSSLSHEVYSVDQIRNLYIGKPSVSFTDQASFDFVEDDLELLESSSPTYAHNDVVNDAREHTRHRKLDAWTLERSRMESEALQKHESMLLVTDLQQYCCLHQYPSQTAHLENKPREQVTDFTLNNCGSASECAFVDTCKTVPYGVQKIVGITDSRVQSAKEDKSKLSQSSTDNLGVEAYQQHSVNGGVNTNVSGQSRTAPPVMPQRYPVRPIANNDLNRSGIGMHYKNTLPSNYNVTRSAFSPSSPTKYSAAKNSTLPTQGHTSSTSTLLLDNTLDSKRAVVCNKAFTVADRGNSDAQLDEDELPMSGNQTTSSNVIEKIQFLFKRENFKISARNLERALAVPAMPSLTHDISSFPNPGAALVSNPLLIAALHRKKLLRRGKTATRKKRKNKIPRSKG